MKRFSLAASLFVIVGASSDVAASNVSPHLVIARRHRADGLTLDDGTKVAVTFKTPPGRWELDALRARGVAIAPSPIVTGAYLADVDDASLAILASEPRVAHVESAAPAVRLYDADVVEATGVGPTFRAALGESSQWLDGTGITIADADADAFVFHPSLFRADAGAFAWIDVDGDGKFKPGVDAIDLDRDGIAGPGEIAALLRMEMRDLAFAEFDHRETFEATSDYVFLDTNANGKRDYGEGFAEETPAFGEPLFVSDDANGNGVLDPGERLLRLGTTKFAKINARHIVYERGAKKHNGIIDYGNAMLADLAHARSPEHGTYMTAIMVGGNGSNRYRGLAPGADVVLVTTPDLDSLDWLVAEPGITSVSMPFGTWLAPLDGSSQMEAIVDALWKRGVVASVGVGNSGTGQGHRTIEITPNVETTATMEGTNGTTSVSFTANTRAAGASLSVVLYDAQGVKIEGNTAAETTSRGTASTMTYARRTTALGNITAKIVLTGTTEVATVHLYATGSYGQELPFVGGGSAAVTVGSPATADSNLAGTGYVIHSGKNYGTTEPTGGLISFASRGPRIDGRVLSGVATPVNPIAGTFMASALDRIAVRAWPGTSTASPQIAAAAALMKQHDRTLDAEAIRAKILAGARREGTLDPNLWGSGKLDVRAATGLALVSKAAPTPRLEIVPGAPRRLHVDVEDRGTMRARWDFDYDGTWDTDWVPLDDVEVPASDDASVAGVVRVVRVAVHDDAGNVSGATATIGPEPVAPAAPAPTPTADDTSSGCAIAVPPPSTFHRGAAGLFTIALLFWRRRRSGRVGM
jgi:hypothetical protein